MPRTLLPFIIAPIVYYLVMSNSISPACTSDVSTALEIVFGSIVMLGSIALGVFHQKKTTDAAGEVAETKAKFAFMTKFMEQVKKFSYKDPKPPVEPPVSI